MTHSTFSHLLRCGQLHPACHRKSGSPCLRVQRRVLKLNECLLPSQIALDNRIQEFEKRNTLVLGVSIDSQFTHNAWRNTAVVNGGIGPVRYPLIADVNHSICQTYGVEHPSAHVALRGAFIIDKQGVVRSQIVNDLPLGRNVDELLRLIDALEFHEKHGEVCPAGWTKGKTGIEPTTEGIAKYLATEAQQL